MMTLYYQKESDLLRELDFVIDDELIGEIEGVRKVILTETLYNIYNECETLSGKEGVRILNERNKYAGTIYMTRKEIQSQIDNGTISVVEHPTGYCTKPDCDRVCASDKSANTCQHEIVTPEKAKARIPVRERMIARFRSMNTGDYFNYSILYAIKLEIKSIEITLSKHGIDITPFNDEIVKATD